MADVNRGARPLSPHLEIYRPQYTMILSITHRIMGVGQTLGIFLIAWWLLSLAIGPAYFEVVDGLMTSWIGGLIMLGSAFAFFYHLCNGVRHLFWDMGKGFDLDTAYMSGIVVVVTSSALTLILLVLAL